MRSREEVLREFAQEWCVSDDNELDEVVERFSAMLRELEAPRGEAVAVNARVQRWTYGEHGEGMGSDAISCGVGMVADDAGEWVRYADVTHPPVAAVAWKVESGDWTVVFDAAKAAKYEEDCNVTPLLPADMAVIYNDMARELTAFREAAPVATAVSDAEVERACRAAHATKVPEHGIEWDYCGSHTQDEWRKAIRAALTAARGGA